MVKRQPDRVRLRPLVALPPRPFSALPLVRRGHAEFCCLAADATSGCSVSYTALPLAWLRHSALRVGVYSCITSCTVLSPSILFHMSPEHQDLAHSRYKHFASTQAHISAGFLWRPTHRPGGSWPVPAAGCNVRRRRLRQASSPTRAPAVLTKYTENVFAVVLCDVFDVSGRVS